ncbi:MAG: hypothetical protein Q7S71_03735 [Candidatus Nitrotoga sp.]|nr:hypothetical protein [Candidatus Nitrotoga sp.]
MQAFTKDGRVNEPESYYRYWGKADPANPLEQKWHPRAVHQGGT